MGKRTRTYNRTSDRGGREEHGLVLDDDTSGHTVGIVVVVDVHHRISLGAVVLRKLKRGRGSVRQVDRELRGTADAVAFLAAGSVGMRSDTSVLDGVEGVVLSDAGNDLQNGGEREQHTSSRV